MNRIFNKVIFTFLLGVFTFSLEAQNPNINQWIDYEKTYYKFFVEEDGLIRIPYSTLENAGIPLVGSDFKLIRHGQEVPIYVSTEGQFLEGDYIEFLGKKNTGSFDTQLYKNPAWQVTPETSMFTDRATYFLVSDSEANPIHLASFSNNIDNVPPKELSFEHTVHRDFPESETPGLAPRIVGGVYNHFADFNPNEGFASLAVDGGDFRNFTLNTPGVVYNGETATVEFNILGRNDDVFAIPDHHIIFGLNGTEVIDTCYEGFENVHKIKQLPMSALQEQNAFKLECIGDKFSSLSQEQNPAIDRNSLAYVTVTYERDFDMKNGRSFEFKIDNEASYLEFTNFSGGSAPVIFDFTNRIRLDVIADNSSGEVIHKVFLPEPNFADEKRHLFLVNSNSVLSTTEIESLESTNFTDFSAIDGDYLLVYHKDLTVAIDGEDQIARYKNYRESEDGGGYKVVLAEINELYDQFAYGVLQHPMSINNFVNYAVNQYNIGNWNTEPEYLHLVGKGVRYTQAKGTANDFVQNLVPTYGSGGDILLAVPDIHNTYIPQLAVGRTSARTPQQVKNYLDKVIEHEAITNNVPCDPEILHGLKKVVHIAGGVSGDEAISFKSHLDDYKEKITGPNICVDVVAEFIKEQQGIVETEQLHPYINDGLMLMTYVGHSGGTVWEFDIRKAAEYTNYGKYPFIISNSCFVGDVFQTQQSEEIMSIDWTTEEDLGAIGFLATVKFGFPTYLHTFTNRLHTLFTEQQYLAPIGKCVQQTINDIYMQNDVSSEGVGRKITCQEFTLLSDPVIKIGRFDKPILHFDENDLIIEPQVLDTSVDSFLVSLALTNYGACNGDSANVVIERTFPDGSVQTVINEPFMVGGFEDTLSFWVQTLPLEGLGTNSLRVYIDEPSGFSAVDCFEADEIQKDIFVVPNAATPVSPCDFGIVGTAPTLRASTSLTSWSLENEYVMEIAGDGAFNNILATYSTNGIGGVIEWKPEIEYEEEKVYYWRVGQTPEGDTEPVDWRESSFIYMDGAEGGWNQSDYFQYIQNRFEGLRIDSLSQEFDYFSSDNFLTCTSGFFVPNGTFATFNNQELASNSCLFGCPDALGGIMISVFKPSQVLEPLPSENSNGESGCAGLGQWGNILCSGNSQEDIFGFHTGTADKINQFNNFLNSIPNGYYIFAYAIRNHRMEADAENAADMQPIVDFFINDLGLDGMADIEKEFPFIVFGKKGDPDYFNRQQVYANAKDEVINLEITVDGKDDNGTMLSTLIGPSDQWTSLVWEGTSLDNLDNRDEYTVEVYKRNKAGESELHAIVNAEDAVEEGFNLGDILAEDYPFLELVFGTRDTFNYSAPQLDYWRVYHTSYPELALDPSTLLSFQSDTLFEGQYGILNLGVNNVMPMPLDSITAQFTVTDLSSNTIISQETVSYGPFEGETVFDMTYSVPTNGLSEDCYVFIQLNPESAQNEKFSFNNQMLIPFYVLSDKLNPIVDVTFDGDHILDGDIISSNPLIDIQLKDENTFLALNDTSLMDIELVFPNGDVRTVGYNDLDVEYTLANTSDAQEKNNVFSVQVNPEFLQDGTYQLQINGKDVSDNEVSQVDYSISFQVITTAAISNVVNYPNPFTTSTQFVFNLTGAEVPDDIRIQIMTVSGKVVKEITRSELGDLRIGRNITEYAWDGTDEYGNELANGVYFYRVTASNDGEEYTYFSQDSENGNVSSTANLDKMYSDGKIGSRYKNFRIGKMYKLK